MIIEREIEIVGDHICGCWVWGGGSGVRSGDGETVIDDGVTFVDVACTSPRVTWWFSTESGICVGTSQADVAEACEVGWWCRTH